LFSVLSHRNYAVGIVYSISAEDAVFFELVLSHRNFF